MYDRVKGMAAKDVEQVETNTGSRIMVRLGVRGFKQKPNYSKLNQKLHRTTTR